MNNTSDNLDYYLVKVKPSRQLNDNETEQGYDMILQTRQQCRAYKAYVKTLGYEAEIVRREWVMKPGNSAAVITERVVR